MSSLQFGQGVSGFLYSFILSYSQYIGSVECWLWSVIPVNIDSYYSEVVANRSKKPLNLYLYIIDLVCESHIAQSLPNKGHLKRLKKGGSFIDFLAPDLKSVVSFHDKIIFSHSCLAMYHLRNPNCKYIGRIYGSPAYWRLIVLRKKHWILKYFLTILDVKRGQWSICCSGKELLYFFYN